MYIQRYPEENQMVYDAAHKTDSIYAKLRYIINTYNSNPLYPDSKMLKEVIEQVKTKGWGVYPMISSDFYDEPTRKLLHVASDAGNFTAKIRLAMITRGNDNKTPLELLEEAYEIIKKK